MIDTVDSAISALYLENVEHALNGKPLDYLIINHMEPDHCANIEAIVKRYPDVKVVGNVKTFQFYDQYYSLDISNNRYEVKEGDQLSLGEHVLQFYFAPMVHWPEVMMTYEAIKGILFAADAFGSFWAFSGNLFYDQILNKELYIEEARRYYTNIVGRYGMQVQKALKKASGLSITMICSLHGLILRGDDIGSMISCYDKWSRYEPEKDGVVLMYGSMYGNTESTVNALTGKLSERGITDMRMYDVSKTHASYMIADVFKYSHMVVAAPTYNMHLYFPMDALLRDLSALGMKDRKAVVIGNHSWASAAVKKIVKLLSSMKNIEILGPFGHPLYLKTRARA